MFDPKIALNMVQRTIANLQNPGKPPIVATTAQQIAALQNLATLLQAQIPIQANPNPKPGQPAPAKT